MIIKLERKYISSHRAHNTTITITDGQSEPTTIEELIGQHSDTPTIRGNIQRLIEIFRDYQLKKILQLIDLWHLGGLFGREYIDVQGQLHYRIVFNTELAHHKCIIEKEQHQLVQGNKSGFFGCTDTECPFCECLHPYKVNSFKQKEFINGNKIIDEVRRYRIQAIKSFETKRLPNEDKKKNRKKRKELTELNELYNCY